MKLIYINRPLIFNLYMSSPGEYDIITNDYAYIYIYDNIQINDEHDASFLFEDDEQAELYDNNYTEEEVLAEIEADNEAELFFTTKYKYKNMDVCSQRILDELFLDTTKPVLFFCEKNHIDRFNGKYVVEYDLDVYVINLATGCIEYYHYLRENDLFETRYVKIEERTFHPMLTPVLNELKERFLDQDSQDDDTYPEPPEPGYEHYDYYDYSETTPANMTEQAQATLESFQKEEHEEIIFTGEFNEGYNADNEGFREYYWMLYIFTRVDGEIKKYKFTRETDYHEDTFETVVPYERALMYKDDCEKMFYY